MRPFDIDVKISSGCKDENATNYDSSAILNSVVNTVVVLIKILWNIILFHQLMMVVAQR